MMAIPAAPSPPASGERVGVMGSALTKIAAEQDVDGRVRLKPDPQHSAY
jgi:hypothetical protein